MLFDLVLRNGPTIATWDGKCASDILSVVEELNPRIRINLKLVGSHNQSLLKQLSTFGVKVIDAYGVCISGTNWDELSHIDEVVQGSTSENDVEYIDGSFLHKVITDSGFYYEAQKDGHVIQLIPKGLRWEWSIVNNEGVELESGESGSLLSAVRASTGTDHLLSGGRYNGNN